ncbi:MAG: hypothetical protein QNJ54_23965 [Prochloraceae cyanobacterium]|nr:hypothetical protein [Prochloraceae cyanobacterium]
MDLRAKKKTQKKPTTQPISTPVEPAKPDPPKNYEHSITIQCHALLYNTLQNTIQAQHTGNDFTYTSVTDLIRAALLAYQSGMELTEIEQPGKKKQTSIRVDDSLYKFYKSLPNQLRTKILEKAIRTFIKNQ